MSALGQSDYPATTPVRGIHVRRHRTAPARPAVTRAETPSGIEPSPITTLPRMLTAVTVALLLALLIGAPGVVHTAQGMPDGVMRTVMLEAGHDAMKVSKPMHLDVAWSRIQTALGQQTQSNSPLLAVAPSPSSSPTPAPTPTAPAVLLGTHGLHPLHGNTGSLHHTRAAPPPLPHSFHPWLRRPTRRAPLRVLVTGDSLSGYLGPALMNDLAGAAPLRGSTDTHDGTGLTRPDFVDWSVVARQQVAQYNPEITVVMIGGNDFQNMTLPNGTFFAAGTPAWTAEYARRAEICMRIWTQNGHRKLYWLSMPPARDPTWAFADRHINVALRRAAARVPGAEFLDILGPVTDHGRYADFVYNGQGQATLVREPDGVHLNLEGSTIVAGEVAATIRREWHIAPR